MGLAVANHQGWSQVFRDLILSNCRYWLSCAQDDISKLLCEMPQVLQALHYALTLPEAWEPARDLILCLSVLMNRHGQGIFWESLLARGVVRGSEEKDPVEIELRLQLGKLYRLQGRLSEAQDCLQAALDLCELYNLQTHYWAVVNQLGLVARLSARHEEALNYCHQVLVEQNLSSSEYAEALNVMGLVAYDRRQWEEALRCFDEALVRYRSLGDSHEIARVLTNRGMVLQQRSHWDKAEKSYREAIYHFQSVGDRIEIFKPVNNLGNIFLMKQDYKAAILKYQESLPVFQQYNYIVELAQVNNNLGMAYTGLGDWQAAESYFLASIESWKNIRDNYNLANVLDNYGKMLLKAGQLRKAYEVLSEALRVLSAAPKNPANSRLQRFIEDRLVGLREDKN